MSFKTILVPFDFSEHSVLALEKACQLGQQLHAELHIVYVRDGGADEDLQRHAMDRLLSAVPPTYEMQNRVHRQVLNGRAHAELIEYSKQHQADLIVVGSRGRAGILSLSLGSVAQRILKEAPCPVVLIRADLTNAIESQDEADIQYRGLKESDSPALDLIARAISLRATDIHIDPLDKEQYQVRFRIDGIVVSYCNVDTGVAERLMHQYRTLARIDAVDPFRPREGRLMLPASMYDFEVRVTTTPVAGGGTAAVYQRECIHATWVPRLWASWTSGGSRDAAWERGAIVGFRSNRLGQNHDGLLDATNLRQHKQEHCLRDVRVCE